MTQKVNWPKMLFVISYMLFVVGAAALAVIFGVMWARDYFGLSEQVYLLLSLVSLIGVVEVTSSPLIKKIKGWGSHED